MAVVNVSVSFFYIFASTIWRMSLSVLSRWIPLCFSSLLNAVFSLYFGKNPKQSFQDFAATEMNTKSSKLYDIQRNLPDKPFDIITPRIQPKPSLIHMHQIWHSYRKQLHMCLHWVKFKKNPVLAISATQVVLCKQSTMKLALCITKFEMSCNK